MRDRLNGIFYSFESFFSFAHGETKILQRIDRNFKAGKELNPILCKFSQNIFELSFSDCDLSVDSGVSFNFSGVFCNCDFDGLMILEVILKNCIKPMIEPKIMPTTIPHGDEPKSKSANQPKISIKTTEPKKTIAADHARPVFRIVSAVDSIGVSAIGEMADISFSGLGLKVENSKLVSGISSIGAALSTGARFSRFKASKSGKTNIGISSTNSSLSGWLIFSFSCSFSSV